MLDWIFPITCELCGESSPLPLCEACMRRLPTVPRPICLYCGTPTDGICEDAWHCRHCRARLRSFDFARSALVPDDKVMQLIHDFKYHGALYLSTAFGELLNRLWDETPELTAHDDWVLVPVPANAEHLYSRGYNQAAELAKQLAARRHLRVLELLERRRTAVSSQTQLSAAARRRNAMEAYRLKRRPPRTIPPHLLLIDDVYTTGSTARACAQALHKLPGVSIVGVLTLVRIRRRGTSS